MGYNISVKQQAIRLRQNGHSIKEIAKILHIAISTSSVWLRNIQISIAGKARMTEKKQLKRYKMSQAWIEKRAQQHEYYLDIATKSLRQLNFKNRNLSKIICALLFWAEGNKDHSHIRFTNSDPRMIQTFLKYLRQSYDIDENKFRVCIHLHEYHNSGEMHQYWSALTNIPLSKFRKAYLKPHTGVRKKENYKGCTTIYYFDSSIAHELEALYNAIGSNL